MRRDADGLGVFKIATKESALAESSSEPTKPAANVVCNLNRLVGPFSRRLSHLERRPVRCCYLRIILTKQ
ncbi:hypothetical protein EVAR_61272_1 [Eumeta japonica]|uniref:Uncharacterized protein n=1 Tax=Eumeta variegata TaxID=151549 RepID=A0A4C1Z717_EUMVA|nr:hypothetical protein EVAR_61272_1 [Eumeta japonica]